MKKIRLATFVPVLLLLCIPVLWQILWYTYGFSLHDIRLWIDQVYIWVNNHYLISIVLYELSMIGIIMTALPMGALLTILAGFLFGAFEGAFWALLGAVMGNVMLFVLVRRYFGDWFQRRYGAELKTFNTNMSEYGTVYILLIHLLPFTPVFFVTVAAAFTKMTITDFMWTCVLGMLPGTLVHTLTGDQLHYITNPADLLSGRMVLLVGISLLLIAIALWARRKHIAVPVIHKKSNNKA